MKIAVSGKGGVGKSTLAGILAHLAERDGKKVLAVDSDPDANLAYALGIPEEERSRIIPVSQQTKLIEERTKTKLKQFAQIFKLNPDISDVADRFSYKYKGINLLVLGAIESGGSGCACPENVFLRSLLSNIILQRDEFVIVDMEAGIEHLGRGTARGVDLMIIVVEPGSQSISTAKSIVTFAEQIGINKILFVGNKTRSETEREYLREYLNASAIMGFIPFTEKIRQAERENLSLIENLDDELFREFENIYKALFRLKNTRIDPI
jgi:CO dehydrogenase maturation factor